MSVTKHLYSEEKIEEFVIAFTDGDCNHLASEIARRFPDKYEFVLSCYYEIVPDKFGNPFQETYWNHAMVRDIITGDIIDIEGIHNEDYFKHGKWKMGDLEMFVHTPEETTLSSEDIDIAIGHFPRMFPEVSIDDAIFYIQSQGWIIPG